MYDSYQLFSFFQIPLGVILKNENKNDDMAEIMTEMHKYVPTKLYEEEYFDEDEDDVIRLSRASIHPILIGGDQLTACRARGAKKAKVNSFVAESRLDSLIPVAEDWHARFNFIEVSTFSLIV